MVSVMEWYNQQRLYGKDPPEADTGGMTVKIDYPVWILSKSPTENKNSF